MKLVLLTTRLFDKPGNGGEICTARLLGGLRGAGHQVVLVGRGDAGAAQHWADEVLSIGPLEPPFDEQALPRRLAAVGLALAAGEAITVNRLGGGRLARRALRCIDAAVCDGVVVDHLQAWAWLGRSPHRPTLLVHHNMESDNYLRRARDANRGATGTAQARPLTRFVMRREGHALRAMEMTALRQAEAVACLSPGDAHRLAELGRRSGVAPKARLHVLPGYPSSVRTLSQRARAPGELPAVGLIGTWTWAPNRRALEWMLTQVWPRLQGRCRLVLAGSGLESVAVPDGSVKLGRIADAGAFYAAVDVVAVPSLTGSGVQEKAIEAIASSRPVVASPHALRGLGSALPAHVLCADDADSFARLCLQAAQAPAAEVAGQVGEWVAMRQRAYGEALAQCLQALRGASAGGLGAVGELQGLGGLPP